MSVFCIFFFFVKQKTAYDLEYGLVGSEMCIRDRAVDAFAAAIDMDPAEVRRRNFIDPDRFPFTTLGGMSYDCGEYERALELAAVVGLSLIHI